jgi:hypothetical protein
VSPSKDFCTSVAAKSSFRLAVPQIPFRKFRCCEIRLSQRFRKFMACVPSKLFVWPIAAYLLFRLDIAKSVLPLALHRFYKTRRCRIGRFAHTFTGSFWEPFVVDFKGSALEGVFLLVAVP